MSYQLESIFGKSPEKPEHTGSIAAKSERPGAEAFAKAELPPETDLAYTRAAVDEALRRGTKDQSLPWENPQSGARGTVTPLTGATTIDGMVCRDFLASYVKGARESWLQGEACQQKTGWEVRSFKPWIRS